MTQVVDREEIERRMLLLKLNPSSLSLKAGLNRWFVRDLMEQRDREPNGKSLGKLAMALGCAISDILTKDPEMADEAPRREMPPSKDGMVPIEELDVRAAAGPGSLHEIEQVKNVWHLPGDLMRSYTATPADFVKIASIVGDSMEPTLMPATKVMIDTRDVRPSPAGVFFVWDGVGLVAKRVEIVPGSDPVRVRLISDNPRYTTYEVSLEEARIQGRVMGRWQWM